MFTDDDQDKLVDLARRAAAQPLDLRDLGNPAKAPHLNQQLMGLSLQIGPLIIAFAHERMPPNWSIYRHLSVSDNGKPADEAVFLEIAKLVGMGDRTTWNTELVHLLNHLLPFTLAARHGFQPIETEAN